MFKDIKHLDAQNPVIGSLIREVDVCKKTNLIKFLDRAPNIKDLEIRSRLNRLSEKKKEFFNRGDDNNNNDNKNNNNNNNRAENNFLPPPPPPPPPFEFFNTPSVPNVGNFLSNNI